jgi:catalase
MELATHRTNKPIGEGVKHAHGSKAYTVIQVTHSYTDNTSKESLFT